MQKLIFITLFAITFTNQTICMKRQRTTAVTDTNKRQCLPITSDLFLPKEIEQKIHKDIVESFKFDNNSPREAALVIKTARAINRLWRNFFDNPDTIRTIISNASHCGAYRGFLANSPYFIHCPSIRNYVEQSERLSCEIENIDCNAIKAFIHAGADINYCRTWGLPVLWKTQGNYEKTKILLDFGADQNIKRCHMTPLGTAIFFRQIEFIKLFLEYKPQKKGVEDAIEADNLEILQLILEQKNISPKEIEHGKEIAKRQGNDTFVQLLDEYK